MHENPQHKKNERINGYQVSSKSSLNFSSCSVLDVTIRKWKRLKDGSYLELSRVTYIEWCWQSLLCCHLLWFFSKAPSSLHFRALALTLSPSSTNLLVLLFLLSYQQVSDPLARLPHLQQPMPQDSLLFELTWIWGNSAILSYILMLLLCFFSVNITTIVNSFGLQCFSLMEPLAIPLDLDAFFNVIWKRRFPRPAPSSSKFLEQWSLFTSWL